MARPLNSGPKIADDSTGDETWFTIFPTLGVTWSHSF
jgi:hypothetical protein